MNDLASTEIIQRLEQRHEQLIAELDSLNDRLEKTLDTFIRPQDRMEAARATNP